ncbi:molybdate ABC transporter substrate-binding protein [Mycolicibacterium sp. GCM10028919]|uniref:molybdate ABC transporter substrate-binding protein n=1 Tax=Mycolicibacterium sp. GCM10028919 TaxID=3273401 RepID=UPI003610C591
MATVGGCSAQDSGGDRNGADGQRIVRVAAAADLKFALEEVKSALGQTNPDIDLRPTYGSSGTFFEQISNGAPFDLYLSADLSYPQQLADAGKADEADVFSYAVGRLAVWSANGSPVDATKGLSVLTDPAVSKVAIANPAHAPYGKAAVAAMQTAGVYDAVQPKLVLGENVAQAAEFAQSGNAQAGVIALSLAVSPQLSDKGRYAEVPVDSYPRIDQGGVVLSAATDVAAARAVKDFLVSQQGHDILKRYGFFRPGT